MNMFGGPARIIFLLFRFRRLKRNTKVGLIVILVAFIEFMIGLVYNREILVITAISLFIGGLTTFPNYDDPVWK